MTTHSGARPTPQLILGLFAILFGVLFTLDNLNVIDASRYWRFWPVVFIFAGISKILQSRGTSGSLGGWIFVLIGTFILLENMQIGRFRFDTLWPMLLVFIGGGMVWQAFRRKSDRGADPGSIVNGIAIMGGFARRVTSQDFQGGSLTAVMGGCEIDLRQASISSGEAIIDTFAFWGGIEIKVPEDWTVRNEVFPFMGGVDDKTRTPKEGFPKHLVIKGFVMMGGIGVKN